MLVLTEAAAEVVKSVTSPQQASDGAGLRIESSTRNRKTPVRCGSRPRQVLARTTSRCAS